MTDKLTIFIIHPSDLLTDHEPFGDGLIVHQWLRLLAACGHRIHVAASRTALLNGFPPNVIIHQIDVPVSALHTERLDYALKVRRLFRELSRREHIDLAHQFNPVVTGLSLGLVGLPIPVVLGAYFPRWPELNTVTWRLRLTTFVKAVLSLVQQQAAAKIVLSTPAAMSMLPFAKSLKNKLVVIPQAVDDVLFAPSERAAGAPPQILFLANIMQRKGVFTLLEAFEFIHREMPEAELVYAGGGFDSDSLRKRVAGLPADIRTKIRFTGKVQRADVPRILAGASVYCLPSHGEPYGMSALEAMAAAKPMVVTNAGGLAQLVPDSGAIKVPPHQARPLADALLRILRSPELQAQLGKANRARVEELHTPARAVARLEATYRSVAAPVRRSSTRLADVRSQGSRG